MIFLLALLDQQCGFVLGKEGSMEFLLACGVCAISARRLTASLHIDAPAGRYRLRVIAFEKDHGGTAAASQY